MQKVECTGTELHYKRSRSYLDSTATAAAADSMAMHAFAEALGSCASGLTFCSGLTATLVVAADFPERRTTAKALGREATRTPDRKSALAAARGAIGATQRALRAGRAARASLAATLEAEIHRMAS